jgi:(2Fe-2S) ferredoxin
MARPERKGGMVISARQARGQVILCLGCCCGRTDRGFSEVPVARIKAAWKSGRLNRTIQLTVSGCVGPCDVANVAVVVGPEGTSWFGGLEVHDYNTVIGWAEECHAAGALLPVPTNLQGHQFEWFLADPRTTIPPACGLSGPPDVPDGPTPS